VFVDWLVCWLVRSSTFGHKLHWLAGSRRAGAWWAGGQHHSAVAGAWWSVRRTSDFYYQIVSAVREVSPLLNDVKGCQSPRTA